MKSGKAVFVLFLLFLMPNRAFCMLKQQYGGNIKIAEDLLGGLRQQPLFAIRNDQLVPLTALPYEKQDTSARIDLKQLDPDQMVDVEKWVNSLSDTANACHWIMDYPYYDHQHPTTITVEGQKLTITSTDAEFLDVVLTSSCLLPPDLKSLAPFQRTQFGYEANVSCLSGRPFLDSISPVQVDPVNPYLSLKLNDVDVATIPEDRFSQISADGSISVIDGPSFYVYLLISGLNSQQADSLIGAVDPKEITRAVLNDHAEILLGPPKNSGTGKVPSLTFVYPQENPYRLLAERLRVQWENKGFTFVTQSASHTPLITLAVAPIEDQNQDGFKYRLLARHFGSRSSEPWFDQWDQLEASGSIIPLLIHHSHIAVRKNIQDLHTNAAGVPDFADCWVFQ